MADSINVPGIWAPLGVDVRGYRRQINAAIAATGRLTSAMGTAQSKVGSVAAGIGKFGSAVRGAVGGATREHLRGGDHPQAGNVADLRGFHAISPKTALLQQGRCIVP